MVFIFYNKNWKLNWNYFTFFAYVYVSWFLFTYNIYLCNIRNGFNSQILFCQAISYVENTNNGKYNTTEQSFGTALLWSIPEDKYLCKYLQNIMEMWDKLPLQYLQKVSDKIDFIHLFNKSDWVFYSKFGKFHNRVHLHLNLFSSKLWWLSSLTVITQMMYPPEIRNGIQVSNLQFLLIFRIW